MNIALAKLGRYILFMHWMIGQEKREIGDMVVST